MPGQQGAEKVSLRFAPARLVRRPFPEVPDQSEAAVGHLGASDSRFRFFSTLLGHGL